MQNKNISSMFRSRTRAIALEPRLLFDGAGAVAAVDGMDDFDFDDQHNDGLVEDVHEAGSEQQNIVNDGNAIEIIDGDDSLHIPSSLGSRLGLDTEQENILAGTEEQALLMIDSRVDNYELLLENVGSSVQVIVVGEGESGLDVLSNALANSNGYDAIHIISHGTPGSFTLGSDQVDSATLNQNSEQLQAWADYLNPGADILLYGCDVAQGETGQSFIDQLAAITGADIAASTNPTGNAEHGGDWVLESETGPIEADVFEIEGYAGLLDGSEKPADITVKDTLGNKGVSIGEKEAKGNDNKVGEGFKITGSGPYSGSITVVGGELSSNGDNGKTINFENKTAAEIKDILDGLTYKYTDNSEVGYTDKLTITITDSNEGESTFTRNINITPKNDAPTMNGTKPDDGDYEKIKLEVDENGNASFKRHQDLQNGENSANLGVWQENLGLYDPDNSAEQIIIKITGLPTNGTLTLDGNAVAVGSILSLDQIDKLKYTHDGSQVLPSDPNSIKDYFKITVDDGAGGLITDQVVEIDLLPVNDEPSISGEITIIQGEGKVNLGTDGNLPVINGTRGELKGVDPDDKYGDIDNLTYEITSLPTVGKLYYDGVEITAAGTVISDLNKLEYEYPEDLEPTHSSVNGKVTFDIKVTDKGGGAGESNAISKTETIEIIVLDNNNDPYFDGVDLEDLTNKDGALVIENIDYTATDKDQDSSNTITITKEMLPLTDADSDKGSLVYTITDSNQTQSGYFTVDGNLLAKDGDDYATFTQADVEADLVKYHLFGNGPEGGRTDFIEFTVKDGAKTIVFDENGGGYARDGGIYATDTEQSQALQKFRLEVNVPEAAKGGEGGDLPDLPGMATEINIGTNTTLEIKESDQLGLKDHLKATDTGIDSPTEKIVFRIEKEPKHGTLYRGETALKIHDSFTQAEIDNGDITYKHGDNEVFSDHFHFSVSNGDIVTSSADNQFNFNITPQNDSPEATPSDAVVGEGNAVEIEIELTDPDNDGAKDKSGYDQENKVGYRVDSVPAHGDLYLVDANGFDINNFNSLTDVTGLTKVNQGDVFQHDYLQDKKLIYIHDGSENYKDGNDPINFKITPIDDANVGIGPDGTGTGNAQPDATNQSSAGEQETINIVVTPRNDAPIFVDKSEPGYDGKDKIYEGESFVIHGAKSYDGDKGKGDATVSDEKYYLVYEDSDSTSTQRQYRVTEAPKYGKLMLGNTVLSVGSVFSQADLDAGKIKYEHDGSENHEDGFDYVVSDGDWTSNEESENNLDTKNAGDGIFEQNKPSTSSRYNIKIAPTNDAPEIDRTPADAADGNKHIVVDSADPENATKLGKFTITDPDLDDDGAEINDDVKDQFRVTVEFHEDLEPVFGSVDWTNNTDLGDVKFISYEDGKLIVEGSKGALQGFLNDLEVKIVKGEDPNEKLTIKVTVDDRIYDAGGNVTGAANGGDKNKGDVAFGDEFNTDTIEIEVWASAVNDTPEIENIPTEVIVNEDGWNDSNNSYNNDGRTKLDLSVNGDNIKVTDKDAFDTDDNTLTISVDTGGIYFSQSGNGLPSGVEIINNGEVGGKTITLKGTKDDLEAALNSIYYKAPQDFNGNDKLTIKYDDGKNIGKDDGDDGQEPESFDEKTVDIHILPVNDTPIIGDLKEQGEDNTGGEVINDNNKYITLNDEYIFSEDTGNAITFTDPDRDPSKGGIDTDISNYGDGHQYADDVAKYTITISAQIENENGSGTGTGTIELIGNGFDNLKDLSSTESSLVLKGTYAEITDALNAGVKYTAPTNDPNAEDKNIFFSITVNDNGDGGTKITDPDTGLRDGLEATTSFYFQRTDKNDAPEFAFGIKEKGDDGANILEKGPTFAAHDDLSQREPVVLDPNARVSDEELDLFSNNGGSWKGAVLKLERGTLNGDGESYTSNANEHDIFDASGNVTFEGNNVKIKDITVGNVTNSGGTLEITFNDNANSDIVNEVLSSITYKNTSDTINNEFDGEDIASVDIIYSMCDGNSNTTSTDGEGDDLPGGQGQNQGTGGKLTGYGKITVDINRQVIAKDDSVVVAEPGTRDDVPSNADNGKVTGDLTPGGEKNNDATEKQDHDPDTDDTITVIEVSQGGKTETVGTDGEITIKGKYGTLVVSPDGSYEYTVDPNNLEVQGLLPDDDEPLKEIFDYKVSDTQGDKVNGYDPNTYADAQLTITINGSNDTVTVGVTPPPANPDEKIHDTDPTKPSDGRTTKDHIVFESGLAGGTNHGKTGAEDSIKVEGGFTIDALDGLDEDKALTITVGSITTDITKAELEDLGTTSKLIDAEYRTLTLKGYSQDANGKITIAYEYELTGKATHDPTVNNGNVFDEITIKVTDRGGNEGDKTPDDNGHGIKDGKDTNTQTIRIQVVDDAPVTEDDEGSIRSGETLEVDAANGVLENDKSGADGWNTEGAVVGVEQGATAGTVDGSNYVIEGTHGTLTLNKDGSYSYQAKPDTGGKTDTFIYTVEDADGNTATAELKITIAESGLTLTPVTSGVEVDEAHMSAGTNPQAGGAVVTKDLPLNSGGTTLGVAGLQDSSGNPVDTITTTHGTVTLEKDGSDNYTGKYTYTLTKAADHSGGDVEDTFIYIAKDQYGNTVENTVTVKIIDDSPEAKDDTVSLGNKKETTGNVLNGTDDGIAKDQLGADGATVTGVAKGSGAGDATGSVGAGVEGGYGTLILKADGSYTYTRNAVVVEDATDVFTYTITDSDGDKSTATITIEIGNKKPKDLVATPDGSVKESGLPSGSTPNDGSNKTTGTITYTPGDGEHTATVKDKDGAEQSVTVGKVIDTPKGKVKITAVEKGKITYEYELTTNTSGDSTTDEFDVTIKDEDGDPATVTVKVGIVNDTPAATADTGNVVQGQSSTGNVITNDKPGADGWKSGGAVVGVVPGNSVGTPFSGNIGSEITTGLGTLTLNKDGTYTYEAKPGVGGDNVKDVFTYTIEDGDGDQVTTTLTIHISDNTPPEANNDFAETDEDTPVSGNLLTNDKDPDGDPITVTEITVGGTTTKVPTDGSNITITVPGKGSITVNKNGGYTFTPNPGVIGKIPDIGYKITDGNGGDDTAKLSINVKPGNPPVAPPPTNVPNDGNYSPLGGTPEITRMKGLTDSAVITDPSVFYEGERHDDVRRLPIPLQPIVYVNNEVAMSQQERQTDDMRADSSPAHIQPFAGQSISLAMGLGQDRNLFVSHAVRDTQRTAAGLDSRVTGRLSRVDLSADDMLASNDLRSMQFAQVDADEAEKAKQKRQQAAQVEENEGREDEVALQEFDADDADIFAEQQSVMPVAASFTEQLRGTSKHLPFAAREKNFLI